MGDSPGSNDQDKYLKYFIVVVVAIAHINPMYRIIICSTDMAVAFNIPVNNIGIYFSKLSGIRSLTMSLGFTLQFAMAKITDAFNSTGGQNNNSNNNDQVTKYMSIGTLVMLTSCQISFLLVLYFSKIPSFHNYIVLAVESLIFGLFQISMLTLTREYAPTYNLSLYVSGIIILITQAISDKVTNKNSVFSVRIQAWMSVILCIVSIGLWSYYVFGLNNTSTSQSDQTTGQSGKSDCSSSSNSSTQSSPQTSALRSDNNNGNTVNSTSSQSSGHNSVTHKAHDSKIDYFMSMSSLSVLKIMRSELKRLCTCTDNRHQITNVQFLINVLGQITNESDICSRVLIRIDLLVVALKEICSLESETILLEQLAFVLRGKYLLYLSTCKTEPSQKITQQNEKTEESTGGSATAQSIRSKREATKTETQKKLYEHLRDSLSQFTMFGAGSLIKDFLFPGVLPYALLEREKCHIINLTTIIFLAIGPVTIFIMDKAIKEFKCKDIYYHGFWACILPKIIIFILSLCAIHTKGGCTHKIRGSQTLVLFMTLTLLMLYGFMETVSVVGLSYYVEHMSQDKTGSNDLQAIQRISTVFFRYLVYKFSVGYNDTRVKSGFILPSFKPPKRVADTFCFWLKGSLANGWKDLIQDFKLNIKPYL